MFNYLKKSVQVLALGLTLALVMVGKPAHSFQNMSGQECQPANLNQALAFGLGWSQLGVTNNSPIGGGSFFVVCPISVDNDADSLAGFTIDAVYLNSASSSIACTFFEIDAQNGPGGTIENAQTIAAINNGAGIYPKQVTATAAQSGFGFTAGFGEDYLSVVCAMHPQTRIEGIYINAS